MMSAPQPPLFSSSPLFFWKGPTNLSREHQKITDVALLAQVRCSHLYAENFALYFAAVESERLQHISLGDIVDL